MRSYAINDALANSFTTSEGEYMDIYIVIAITFSMIALSVFCEFIFIILEESKIIYPKFVKVMKIMRMFFAGPIISLFLMDHYSKTYITDKFSNIGDLLLNNSSFIILFSVGTFVSLSIYLQDIFIKKKNKLNNVIYDTKNGSLNIESKTKRPPMTRVRFVNQNRHFNEYYAPKIYVFLVFLHAFFAGIGFFLYQKFGLLEFIITVSKAFEILHFRKELKILGYKNTRRYVSILLFTLITPIGFFFRETFMLYYPQLNMDHITKFCHCVVLQSLFIMVFVESFIPLPKKSHKLVINFIITLVSACIFDFFFQAYFIRFY